MVSTCVERLWLKTNIKLARLWFDRKDFESLTKKLRELHKACQKEDGTDDPSKGTYSLEIYAIEILMYAETRNNKRLKSLYQRALRVKSAVPHPAVVGTIRDYARTLLVYLGRKRGEDAKTRPIVFLGHCLGGLIVKQVRRTVLRHMHI